MGKEVVVVLNIGGVIETASWKEQPDAILLAWQAGQETGNAIADVLSGKVNPSGKLAVTFPVKYEDHPSAATFPGKELPREEPEEEGGRRSFMRAVPAEIVYDDDIYVGYRYFDAYAVETSYPFGYGLSYTDFEYGELKLGAASFDGSMTVEVEITNSGNMAGKEVVQLYQSAPSNSMNKPVKELKAFTKTRLLQPGESEAVRFMLDQRSLCSFDRESSSWKAEQGTYEVLVGASSANILQQASFQLKAPIQGEKVTRSLLPQQKIDVLVHE
jgi:beta-glucosidase